MGTVKYSGPVASFHCPTEATIRSLKVHFSPKQLGEGTPSPENVREIEGWDGVEVQRCGENLFPAATYTRTASGITFTYYPNGDVHIEGTATTATWLNVPTSMYFTIFPGTYTISGNKNNSNVSIYLVVSKDNGGDIKFYTSDDIPSSKIINFTDNQARVQIAVSGGKTVNVTVHPRLEKGNYTELETTEYEFGVLGKNKVPFLVDSKTISSQINGNAGWCNVWKIPNKNLKYTYSAYIDNTNNTNTANITVWLKNIDNTSYVDGTAKSGTQIAAGAVGRSTITLDASTLSNTYYFVFGITSFIKSGETASCTFSNPMVEIGDTATTYEPYNPNKTVYGGWVDLVSGEVASTYIHCKIKDLPGEWNYRSGNNRFQITLTGNYANAASSGGIWTHFATSEVYATSTSNGYGNKQIATYIDKHIYIRDDDFEGDVEAFLNSVGDTYITYELAELTTYSLSPTQLQTFLGQNNIWSNADYVEIEYDLHETQDILARKQFIVANQPHVESTSGTIASFETGLAAPLKECKTYFEPIQDLHGYDKPWIGGVGKNLFDESSVIYGVWTAADGTVSSNTRGCRSSDIAVIPGETYTAFYKGKQPYSESIIELDENKNFITRTHMGWAGTSDPGILHVTLGENTKYIYLQTYVYDSSVSTMTPEILATYKIQLEKGSVSTEYEPYENICPINGWGDMITSANRAPLPEEYQEIEYIQGNSVYSYFITNYYPNEKTDFYIKIQDGNSVTDDYKPIAFSAGSLFQLHKTGYYSWVFSKGDIANSTAGYQVNRGLIEMITKQQSWKILSTGNSEVQNRTVSAVSAFQCTTPLVILAGEQNEEIRSNKIKDPYAKLYRFTLYENEQTVRDYIPCYRKSDNEVGLYDLVNKTFLTHSGEGTFDAGPNITTGSIIYTNWTTEAGTIYGGYIDLIKGELIQTHKKVTVADLSWRTVTNLGAGGWATFSQTPSDISRASTIISNSYKTSTTRGSWSQYQNDDDYIISKYAPSDNLCIVIRDSRYETTEDFITNQGNAEIIYELASPIHYILTPQTLKTLRGTNNIWSSANGDVEVKYWTH